MAAGLEWSPYPEQRFAATHPRYEPHAGMLLVGIRAGGQRATAAPAATQQVEAAEGQG